MALKVTVIIPALNEEKTISKVVKDFRRALPDADIVVYDNNSGDRTKEEAERAGAKVVIQYMRGKGNSVRKAFEDIDSDIYVIVDADDTYPADDVKKLMQPVLSGEADMTVGSRLNKRASGSLKFLHIIGNRIITGIVNFCFGKNLEDILSGYRVMTRALVKNIMLTSSGFEVETELTIRALASGYAIKEIPVEYRSRHEGSESKLKSFSDGYLIFYTILTLFRDYRPMLFFSVIALFFLTAGFLLGMIPLVEWIETGAIRRFPTAILSSLLIIVGLQVLMLGLISDLINKKWAQVMERLRR